MTDTTFTAYEALRIALEMEAEGIRFYEALAEAVSPAEMQQLARQLADAEREHVRRIEALIDAEDYASGWSDDDLRMLEEYVREQVKREIFPGREEAAELSPRLANLFDGFTLAIGFERQTIEYYRRLHESCTYEPGRRAFAQLVAEEERHEALLTAARGKLQ